MARKVISHYVKKFIRNALTFIQKTQADRKRNLKRNIEDKEDEKNTSIFRW